MCRLEQYIRFTYSLNWRWWQRGYGYAFYVFTNIIFLLILPSWCHPWTHTKDKRWKSKNLSSFKNPHASLSTGCFIHISSLCSVGPSKNFLIFKVQNFFEMEIVLQNIIWLDEKTFLNGILLNIFHIFSSQTKLRFESKCQKRFAGTLQTKRQHWMWNT